MVLSWLQNLCVNKFNNSDAKTNKQLSNNQGSTNKKKRYTLTAGMGNKSYMLVKHYNLYSSEALSKDNPPG